VRSALFVAGENVFHFAALEKQVEKAEEDGSGMAEYVRDAFAFKSAVNYFGP
jgi:hypothetical protein